MNKENTKENNEELNAEDLQVISRLQNLRKEIKAPYDAFLKAMKMIEEPTISPLPTPTKSPFYIPTFFKISVPALVFIFIVGISVKNNLEIQNVSLESKNSEISTMSFSSENPSEETFSNKTALNNSEDMASSAMLQSAPSNESPATAEMLTSITEEEFSAYSNSSDEKFASYDDASVNSFTNYYGQNF